MFGDFEPLLLIEMRFIVGSNSAGIKRGNAASLFLAFDLEGSKLIATGEADGHPDVVVHTFDPNRDIFYRVPEPLTPDELTEEIAIHVPASLRDSADRRFIPGSIDGFIIIQSGFSSLPAISALAALNQVLRAAGSVNSAILQAENGGMLWVRKSGIETHAGASARSLKDFLAFSEEEREHIFPDFHASEVFFSGADLDHFQNLNLEPISTSRRITLSEFSSLCEFTSEVATLVGMNPHLYTLVIGAAAVYAKILRGSWEPSESG